MDDVREDEEGAVEVDRSEPIDSESEVIFLKVAAMAFIIEAFVFPISIKGHFRERVLISKMESNTSAKC
jgi:hypothetical protein